MKWAFRILLAVAGSSFGALLVAALEAWKTARSGGAHAPGMLTLMLADLGVLAPLAEMLGLVVGAAIIFLEPEGPVAPSDRVAALRAEPAPTRSRTAAIALLGGCAFATWLVAIATTAR